MKYFWFIIAFLCFGAGNAQELVVKDVRVSITADSAATAREQALDRAHTLAFQKLLAENFPDKAGPLPSQETIINMVTDFSIEREKTTPKSYAASLTFQFDKAQFQAWLQQGLSPSQKLKSPLAQEKPLNITATYMTFAQWRHIKNTIENLPGIQKMTILAFSPQDARLEIIYGGNMEKLQQYFLKQNLILSPQGDIWIISANSPKLP